VDKILINAADPEECRVAMIDSKGTLQEFYTDSALRLFSVNNIYKGIIHNVEPSLQAAFVNFGPDRHGFLQIADIHPEYYMEPITGKSHDIRRLLHKNQPVLVQVLKEPTAIKGASLTTFISLAGRFVVLTPGRGLVGVSRKIQNEKERYRLREIAAALPVPAGCGYIVRTVAEERTRDELALDLYEVFNLWEDIRKESLEATAPSLIYQEKDLAIKILRDHYNTNFSEIIVDEPVTFQKVQAYIKSIAPGEETKVHIHSEKRPLFARHQLERQLDNVRQSRVRLKSGGSIVITPTEALVSIDVNSGKSTKEEGIEETALATNLEAADEVARQLRLRDLGGVIVIDFIDMRMEKHRKEVERRLREASQTDKAKMDFARISRFGLLELTRQRIYPPVESGIYIPCPHCDGKGQVYTPESASLAFLRQAAQKLSTKGFVGFLKVRLNQEVADYTLNYKRSDLLRLEERHKTRIYIQGDPTFPPSKMILLPTKKGPDKESPKIGLVKPEDSAEAQTSAQTSTQTSTQTQTEVANVDERRFSPRRDKKGRKPPHKYHSNNYPDNYRGEQRNYQPQQQPQPQQQTQPQPQPQPQQQTQQQLPQQPQPQQQQQYQQPQHQQHQQHRPQQQRPQQHPHQQHRSQPQQQRPLPQQQRPLPQHQPQRQPQQQQYQQHRSQPQQQRPLPQHQPQRQPQQQRQPQHQPQRQSQQQHQSSPHEPAIGFKS
jgi:ribonuclease E